MAKTKEVKTKAEKKDVSPTEVGTETTKAALKKQEDNKDLLAIDPSIEQLETKKAEEVNAKAMEEKLAQEAVVQEQTNAMSADIQVNREDVKARGTIVESADLKKAVKADAEKRKKTYVECPVNGVLIVK